MTDHAIEIRGLMKTFPNFQLGPVEITVPRGAIYGLIGPNAAGKTTTVDLILGMGREDGGSIRVFGPVRLGRSDSTSGEVEAGWTVWGRTLATAALAPSPEASCARTAGLGVDSDSVGRVNWIPSSSCCRPSASKTPSPRSR